MTVDDEVVHVSDASDLQGMLDRLRAGQTIDVEELQMPEGGFAQEVLGLAFDHLSLDRVQAHMEIDPRLHQPYGIVHGGVWCGVVETLASFGGAMHAMLDGRLCVGVSNATDFLRAHREGRVDAVATPIHVGRVQQLWQVVLTRDDGKTIARGQVRLQNVDPAQIGG